MRKFHIKNRQKRKYTRKGNGYPTSMLPKGIFVGVLPMLVVAVALVTTLLLSHKIQLDQITFDFSYQPPQFSWDSSISVINNMTYFMQQLWLAISSVAIQTSILLQMLLSQIFQGLLLLGGLCWQMIVTVSGLMLQLGRLIVQVSLSIQQVYTTVLMTTIIIVWDSIVAVSQAIIHYSVITVNFIWDFLTNAYIFLGTILHIAFVRFVAFVDATLYFLGTPFRALGAFWVQIKPYVDILLAHIQMSFDDLNNGFKSLNSISKL